MKYVPMDAPFLSIGTVNPGELYKLLTIDRCLKNWSKLSERI